MDNLIPAQISVAKKVGEKVLGLLACLPKKNSEIKTTTNYNKQTHTPQIKFLTLTTCTIHYKLLLLLFLSKTSHLFM
jgi:predicted transcriptional regulator